MASSADDQKRQAADAALTYVQSGQTLGLGTGSTAAHFVRGLGARVRDGLDVQGIVTSEETKRLALAEGIEVIEPDETTQIDLAVDGADEVNGDMALIKGGGGALLREKIIARAAARFVVIADGSKRVAQLGAFPLPVEIDQAHWPLTVTAVRGALAECGFPGANIALRGAASGQVGVGFVTDGGHYVLDCALGRIDEPAALEQALQLIPGVVETGLFLGMADEVILAGPDGVTHLRA